MAAIYDRRALFSQHWVLQQLNDAEADRLLKYSRMIHLPANKQVFRQGDPGENMIAVLGGCIKISAHSAEGKEITLNLINPGEIFGELGMLTRTERSADATTLKQTDLLVIERRDFMPLLERNPHLSIALLEVVCHRLRKTSGQVEEVVFLDRSAKLAKALLRLADDHGADTSEGIRIDLKLSQRELGNMVGLTRESMNKQLANWREDGIVRMVEGTITILNRDALEDLSSPA